MIRCAPRSAARLCSWPGPSSSIRQLGQRILARPCSKNATRFSYEDWWYGAGRVQRGFRDIQAFLDSWRRWSASDPKWQSSDQTLPPATLSQPTPAMSARRTMPDSASMRLFPTPVRRAIIGLKVLVRWRCPNQVIRSAFLQVPISRVILVRYGGLRLAPHTGLPVVGLPDPIEGGHRVPVSRSARRLDACPTRLTGLAPRTSTAGP